MKILVTGATGTVGGQLVTQLLAKGHHVRALTRNPQKANFPPQVEVVAGDLAQPETLVSALEGVEGLHLLSFAGDDYAPLQTMPEIMRLAEAAGVQRVTLLMGSEKGEVEAAVEASNLAWTLLQPVEFMSNILSWADAIRQDGVVKEAFGARQSAIVHEADIAAVAATALTEAGHGGKTYAITGGEVLTPPQLVEILSQATQREIRFEELSEDQARAQWKAEGYDDESIEYFVWMYGNTPEIGKTVSNAVKQVTGKPPRTFAQWAAEHADAFR